MRTGQYQGDTCHHSQGDTWHQVTSSMTWQHGRTTAGSTAVYVASRWPNQMTTRVQFWLVKKGCHVAHSGAATWHPIVGGFGVGVLVERGRGSVIFGGWLISSLARGPMIRHRTRGHRAGVNAYSPRFHANNATTVTKPGATTKKGAGGWTDKPWGTCPCQ
jgi:hypothetical protein